MPDRKPAATKRRAARKRPGAAAPRGPTPAEMKGEVPPQLRDLTHRIEADGGVVLAAFRDPLGGNWQLLAGLPLEVVEPTPYQRDLSDAHVRRLAGAVNSLGRFLDPVKAVPAEGGRYWTPNGNHRLEALKRLAARSVTALVVPEPEVARRILMLNTEKPHNLRERALEVIRLAHALAVLEKRPERDFEAEFEDPALLTLGACYQRDPRFAGAAYHPLLKRIDEFLDLKLENALAERSRRAERLGELAAAVDEAVVALREKGFDSPYLRVFVVARINPLRFQRGARGEFYGTVRTMLAAARKFDAARVRADQLARAAGRLEEDIT